MQPQTTMVCRWRVVSIMDDKILYRNAQKLQFGDLVQAAVIFVQQSVDKCCGI